MLFACKTQLPKANDTISIYEGNGKKYLFNKLPDFGKCKLNTLSNQELAMQVELNHQGDRDDRVPRKIISNNKDAIIAFLHTKTDPSNLSAKLCMNKMGKLIAVTLIDDNNLNAEEEEKILRLFADYTYSPDENAGCLECISYYLSTKS